MKQEGRDEIRLPEPRRAGGVSVEEAMLKRDSVRRYKDEPLTLEEVSQLLWATQGMTDPAKGSRTAPSAGALYPLETYLVAGNVDGLESGLYHYEPQRHALRMLASGDMRAQLATASLKQPFVGKAAISIVLTIVYPRITGRYGERGRRYAHAEAGHAAQNVHLQVIPHLGTVMVGAFDDDAVAQLLGLSPGEEPFYIMPVGRI